MTRCFVSIDIPEKFYEEIEKIQGQLLKSQGKYTKPENLHLTLKFLGELTMNEIEEVRKRLRQIRYAQFETAVGDAGFFDNARRGKKDSPIWLHLTNCEGLQKIIDESLVGLFEKERRFQSHLTIARVKPPYNTKFILAELRKIKISEIKFVVDNFRLKKSNLGPDGSKYETIEEYILN